jgi:thiamine biosynthesis lipoprotein
MPLISLMRQRKLMGTVVNVVLSVAPEEQAHAAAVADACLDWLSVVEARLTRFNAASEISQLNTAQGEWFVASDMLFAVAQAALDAARQSAGLFDPTLLGQLEALGYDRDFQQIARREAHAAWRVPTAAAVVGGWRAIELDPDARRIRLPVGVRLDLSGIAKGWAADAALARFFPDFPNVIVDLGGDMRVRGGPQAGELWGVGIADPRGAMAGDIALFSLGDGGIATSGATHRWWYRAGTRQHHLLDPRTGHPARVWVNTDDDADPAITHLIASATALAPTATQAEVAAKVALLRSYPLALGLVEDGWRHHDAGSQANCDTQVALVLILGTGEIMPSANLADYFNACQGGGTLWAMQ